MTEKSSQLQNFGALVKHYRSYQFGWTQKELAQKADVKLRTLQDIETAQKVHLDYEVVDKLATAFAIKDNDREQFFGAAGLLVQVNPQAEPIQWAKVIFDFYKSVEFPAFAVDELFDVHSVNSYLLELLDVPLNMFSQTFAASPGPNLLRFLFDPAFNARKLYGHYWEEYAQVNVALFRNLARVHLNTERYQSILMALQKMKHFEDLWKRTEQMAVPLPPYLGILTHPKYGALRYWHSGTVQPNLRGEQMFLTFYIPADSASEAAFEQMRSNTHKAAYELNKKKGFARIF